MLRLLIINNESRGIVLKGKIISVSGILGIIVTVLVTLGVFSSNELLGAPFLVIGVLLSIIIIALGEILDLYEKQINGGDKKEK